MSESNWLDVEQAASYLGISQSNLYALAQGAKVPGHKLGKVWKFNREDLDKWIRVNKSVEDFFLQTPLNLEGNSLVRDPQVEAYQAASSFFAVEENKKAIIQLPVGCGKSGLISLLPFGISRGRVLVIAPNVTIRQGLQKSLDLSDRRNCFWTKCRLIDPELFLAGPFLAVLDGKDANIHDCQKSHIVLTNIQQLASSADKWLPQFPDDFFDMILVDEGHHSAADSWKKVFEKFPNAKVANLTATPFRSDQKQIDGQLIYRYSFRRAMIKGYIKKLHATYVAPDEIYFTYHGDANKHTLEEVMKLKEEDWFSRGVALAQECNKSIVDASLEKLESLRISGTNHQLIAVACSVAHARAIRSLYAERGYEAAEIYSQMPEEEKAEVMQKLKNGLLDCIVQVQMLGEGFDHPHLSVAAIFRPFRSLPPYVQFVGRILRVINQNSPNHPDNIGWVATHIGLNQDVLLEDFKELEREDQMVFQELFKESESEQAQEGEGKKRLKLREQMVVSKEIVSSFMEEDFFEQDEALLLDELKKKAEELGFDPEALESMIKAQKSKRRMVDATAPFPVSPQNERRETRKRLSEEVRRAANILLNRLEFSIAGRDLISLWGAGGNNFVVTVQKINKKIQEKLSISSGQLGTLGAKELKLALGSLDEILNELTREVKGRMNGKKKG